MGYSRKIGGKNKNLRKRSRKGGFKFRKFGNLRSMFKRTAALPPAVDPAIDPAAPPRPTFATPRAAVEAFDDRVSRISPVQVDDLEIDGNFIYVCCNLYDENVINTIKYFMKKPDAKIWLNVNSYNIVGKGGKPFDKIENAILSYLTMLCNKTIIKIEDARKFEIYCLNSSPVFNNSAVSDWYKKNGYNKVTINPFGLKKMQKILTKFGYINDKRYENLDYDLFSKKDNEPSGDPDKNSKLRELLIIYNEALENLEALKIIPADEAIKKWTRFCTEKNIVTYLETNKTQISEITKDSGIYTQAQKVIDSIVRGPLLPHDHLGLLVASYIHTNKYRDKHDWDNIHNPVDIKCSPVAITEDRNKYSGFDSYLYKLLNKEDDFSKNMHLPDVIYHDCEEDDIAAMQYIGIHKKDPFTCIVQSSLKNADKMRQLLPNMVPKETKIRVNIFSLSDSRPKADDLFKNFTENEPANSHISDNKTLKALENCKNSTNSFVLTQDNEEAAVERAVEAKAAVKGMAARVARKVSNAFRKHGGGKKKSKKVKKSKNHRRSTKRRRMGKSSHAR